MSYRLVSSRGWRSRGSSSTSREVCSMRTSPLFSSFFLHPSPHLPTTSPFSLRLAILDEVTSALDLTNEAVMYNALQKILGSLTSRSAIGPHCCDSMRAG